MPTFICNPNDPPMQRMLDKLVAAGWIQSSVKIDKGTTADPHAAQLNIKWTTKGRTQCAVLIGLCSEIEKASMPLDNEEFIWLIWLSKIANLSGGFLPPR